MSMPHVRYLSEDEIDARGPKPPPEAFTSSMADARSIARKSGYSGPGQQLGTRWPVGCVALEVTQRCNLDCTLCYLSEKSEAVRDLPIEELFRRIDTIHRHYGPGTDVQVTGGEPTLRNREELLAVVRRVRERGMRPTLMTNGIRATRSLLAELAAAGLEDVAFHVDTTQRRKGHATESDLHEVRARYIAAAEGLPLSVMFNTTVHEGNFDELPELVRFFRAHAGRVRTASFQLQADTGRGIQGKRSARISLEEAAARIARGADTSINFAASLIGHPGCNRYGLCLEANGRLYDAFDDAGFIARLQAATAGLVLHRNDFARTALGFLRWLSRYPSHWGPVLGWTLKKAWRMKGDLLAARGRVRTLSFVLHNFMDGKGLERERIDACVFMTMTQNGPVSMCLHNAKRDDYILQPVWLYRSGGPRYWHPLSGESEGRRPPESPPGIPLKRLKGRARRAALEAHVVASASSGTIG